MSDTGLLGWLSESLRKAWLRNPRSSSSTPRNGEKIGNANLLFQRARIMARAGDIAMAARLYADAAALEPTLAEAFEAHAEILDLAGQRELAAKQYALARNARALLRQGTPDRHFALRQRGHFVAEIMAYDSVLWSLTKNAMPHLARGNAYLASGRPDRALADYDRALKLKPNLQEILALRGEALSKLGRYEEALEAFDAAMADRSNDAEILSGRAIARIALGLLEEANADWRHQLDLLDCRAAASACVALRLADYETALPYLESALVKEPADPYWQLYRFTAQARLGIPLGASETSYLDGWPGPLLELHQGRMNEDEILARADTDCRLAEAHFQMGVVAIGREATSAERHWREAVKCAAPHLIEYAAARNELSRLVS